MNIPDLYNQKNVGTWYQPRVDAFYNLGKQSGIPAVEKNDYSVLVIGVDDQSDFIIPGWALPVDGAVNDSVRFCEWGFANVGKISKYLMTKDRHKKKSIFHASWWVNSKGEHPKPFDVITLNDVLAGVWKPLYDEEWSIYYLGELEKGGKRQLRIWPDHCIEGTDGQKLLPAIEEMLAYHSGARSTIWSEHDKGIVPQVEHYGAVRAEVAYPGRFEDSGTNYKFVRYVKRFNKIVVAGQAKSHCVLDTVDQLISEAPEIAPKMYLLTDCTSAIAGTEEFTEQSYSRLAKIGLNLVTTKDQIF